MTSSRMDTPDNNQAQAHTGEQPARALVLVRIGSDHRMTSLLRVPRELRQWDLALSFYDHLATEQDWQYEYRHFYQGGKWDGIYRFFTEHSEIVERYDLFWLVDDDIETSPEQLDLLLAYVRAHQFELAQPALTLDSYYSHRLTLVCPGFAHRHTNLVEIMAPILSKRLLQRVLPVFAFTRSGYGIDWYWQKEVENPQKGIAIVDAYPVSHRRPLRQHLVSALRNDGICPLKEREVLVDKLKLKKIHAVGMAGEMKNGIKINSKYRMIKIMSYEYFKRRKKVITRPIKIIDIATIIFHHINNQ